METPFRYEDGELRTGGIPLARLAAAYGTPLYVYHRPTIEADFQQRPPATVAEAAARIEALTGIRRKPTQVRQFLKALGMQPRKVGMIPAKADVEAQEVFKKTVWSRG